MLGATSVLDLASHGGTADETADSDDFYNYVSEDGERQGRQRFGDTLIFEGTPRHRPPHGDTWNSNYIPSTIATPADDRLFPFVSVTSTPLTTAA